jgi:hypothetical protein
MSIQAHGQQYHHIHLGHIVEMIVIKVTDSDKYIVTRMTIARQRLGKNIPEVLLPTIGHPLLGNGRRKTNS